MTSTSLVTPSRLSIAVCAVLAIGAPVWLLRDQTTVEAIQSLSKPTPFNSVALDEPDAALVAPLFNVNRTEPPPLDSNGGAENPQSATAGGPPILVGIVSGGGKAALALLKGSDGNTEIVRAGDNFSGWRVVQIERQSITIAQAGQAQELKLDYRDPEALPSPPSVATTIAPPGPGPK